MNELYLEVAHRDRIISVVDSDVSHNQARRTILSSTAEEGVLRSRLDLLQSDIERIQQLLISKNDRKAIKHVSVEVQVPQEEEEEVGGGGEVKEITQRNADHAPLPDGVTMAVNANRPHTPSVKG